MVCNVPFPFCSHNGASVVRFARVEFDLLQRVMTRPCADLVRRRAKFGKLDRAGFPQAVCAFGDACLTGRFPD